MMVDWRPMSLQEFIELCQRTHDAFLRCAEFRRAERGIFAITNQVEEVPFVGPAMEQRGNPRNDKCHNCGQGGHFQRDCPQPRKKCGTCGRAGHRTEQCRRIVTERPLGQQTALIRNTRNGIFIEMTDNQNKTQILEQLATFFNGQAEKQKEMRNKARERRRREKAPGQPNPDDSSEGEQDDGTVDLDPNERMVTTVRLSRGPKWWIKALVAGIPTDAILDTGAEVSVLTEAMWNLLPTAVRANAGLATRRRQKIKWYGRIIAGHGHCGIAR